MIASIREILLSSPAVAALINDRVYPLLKPLNERRACVVLKVVSDVPEYHMEGDAGWGTGRFDATCWAPTYAEASVLAKEVRKALTEFTGEAAENTIGWIEQQNRFDVEADPVEGQNMPDEYGILLDFELMLI